MTRAELRSQLVEVAGLDLTDSEANSLINEGYRELCVQSEWIRPIKDLGPGVAGQRTYAFPLKVQRILKLSIDGLPYEAGDEDTYLSLVRGDLITDAALFWSTSDDNGADLISVYPEPSGGEGILATCVAYPTDLTDDADVPVTPENPGDRAILNYCQAQVLGDAEDDIQTRDYFLGEFSRLAADVRGLRYSRVGRKRAHVRIEGINA